MWYKTLIKLFFQAVDYRIITVIYYLIFLLIIFIQAMYNLSDRILIKGEIVHGKGRGAALCLISTNF